MTISIAMATYNGGKWLADQLASIKQQTLLPDELVISDDASDDDTVTIAKDFAENAPFPVRLFVNNTRLGSKGNFFRAIGLCTGDLIALCDQDDVWLSNKLERLKYEFANPDTLLAMHRVTVVDAELNALSLQPNTHWYEPGTYAALTTRPWFTPSGMSIIFRKNIFSWIDYREAATFTMMQMGHDGWIWFLAASLGQITVVSDRLALYRQHSDNVVGSGSDERPHEAIQTSIRTGSSTYTYLAELSSARADKLRKLAPPFDSILLQKALNAVRYYAMLADFYTFRSALYKAGSKAEKASQFSLLCRRKAYKSTASGGLGMRAFAKDLFLNLVKGSPRTPNP